METEIFVKKINITDSLNELISVGFDETYAFVAKDKYKSEALKIFNIRCEEASILKQLSLSLGFDCAVNRAVLLRNIEFSDCILNASICQYKQLIKKLKQQPFRLKNLSGLIEANLLNRKNSIKIRNSYFDWSKNTYLMGILNVTPDSFSDGGECTDEKLALEKALRLIDEGADILDIGGESTRPNYTKISVEKEIERILPIIKLIRQYNQNIPISIDTQNVATAKVALEFGADIINDISAFDNDMNMAKIALEYKCPVVLNHSAKSGTKNVVDEVYKYFVNKVRNLKELGLNEDLLIIDTGIGFSKTLKENFELIKHQSEFNSLNQPILVGISRKSLISKTLYPQQKELDVQELDIMTNIFTSHLIASNTNILRVHNVSMAKKAIELSRKII